MAASIYEEILSFKVEVLHEEKLILSWDLNYLDPEKDSLRKSGKNFVG